MDSSEVTQLIIIGVLLLLSAFFSSAETALTTVNKLRIRSLAEDEVKEAVLVNRLIENPSKMFSAILIGNTIVKLSASSIATALAIHHYNRYCYRYPYHTDISFRRNIPQKHCRHLF